MNFWTPEEVAELLRLIEAGTPMTEISLPGKSTSACYNKLRYLKIPLPGKSLKDGRLLKWEPEEVRSLRRQFAAHGTIAKISIEGKSPNAIDSKLRELKIHPALWTKEQLVSLRAQALIVKSIAEISIPGKDLAQITVKVRKLRLDPATRPLSEEELKALQKFAESGASPENWKIAGRSIHFLVSEARKRKFRRPRRSKEGKSLAIAKLRMKPIWTVAEEQELRSQLAAGIPPSEMTIPGRSKYSIQQKATRLNLVGDGISRQPWNDDERRKLRELVAKGWKTKRIFDSGAFPGKSYTSIQKQISRNNLADPERVVRARNGNRFPPDVLDRFVCFLQNHAATCTPEEIMLLWNQAEEFQVKVGRVRYYLEELGIKLSQYEVRRLPYSQAKMRKSRKSGPQQSSQEQEE